MLICFKEKEGKWNLDMAIYRILIDPLNISYYSIEPTQYEMACSYICFYSRKDNVFLYKLNKQQMEGNLND